MFRRVVSISAAAVAVALVAVGVSGKFIFADARGDVLRSADAVVVLGGEHDGRERYGIALARQLGASTVLLSNPYPPGDALMSKLCGGRTDGVDVVCERPSPMTTRGEAIMARRIGQDRGWTTIVVVTWQFHLPRARKIFDQCYSGDGRQTIMHAVPKSYDMPMAMWEYVYLYQYGALLKNYFQSSCDVAS